MQELSKTLRSEKCANVCNYILETGSIFMQDVSMENRFVLLSNLQSNSYRKFYWCYSQIPRNYVCQAFGGKKRELKQKTPRMSGPLLIIF